MLSIDIHTHILPPTLARPASQRYGYGGFVRLEHYRAVLRADDALTTGFSATCRTTCWEPEVPGSTTAVSTAWTCRCSAPCR